MLSSRHSFLKSLLLYYYTRVLTGTDTTRSSLSHTCCCSKKVGSLAGIALLSKGSVNPLPEDPKLKRGGVQSLKWSTCIAEVGTVKEIYKFSLNYLYFFGIKGLYIFFYSLLQCYNFIQNCTICCNISTCTFCDFPKHSQCCSLHSDHMGQTV